LALADIGGHDEAVRNWFAISAIHDGSSIAGSHDHAGRAVAYESADSDRARHAAADLHLRPTPRRTMARTTESFEPHASPHPSR